MTNRFIKEMSTVKISEYSPDAKDSKHSRAAALDPGMPSSQAEKNNTLELEKTLLKFRKHLHWWPDLEVRQKQPIWVAVKATGIWTGRCLSMRTCVSIGYPNPFGCQRTWMWVSNHCEEIMIRSEWMNTRRSKMVCLNTMCACFVNSHCKAVVFR